MKRLKRGLPGGRGGVKIKGSGSKGLGDCYWPTVQEPRSVHAE